MGDSKGFWRWMLPPAVAAMIWLLPHSGFAAQTWGLLSVFAAAIAGMIAQPLPAGAVVLILVTAANLFGILSVQQALSGFSNTTVWLIVAAFIFARGFSQTRLGERIAYNIIAAFGGSSLRLAYSLVLADLVMGPVTASNTARAGSVLFPITQGIARAFDSQPGATAGRLGAFLMKALFHGDLVVSAMFLTSMAGNPLVAEMAKQASGITVSWGHWALAASFPGAIGITVIPYAVYRLCPPELQNTQGARRLAREHLGKMGPMSRDEKVMLLVFILVLSLWISATWHGVSSTMVAYVGIGLLLIFRVLRWQDLLEEKGAWDALIWFGGLVMLAERMNEVGLLKAFAGRAALLVEGWHWPLALAALLLIYLYSHYVFAGLTAHITAMFPAFFAVALTLGAPPLLAALALGFFSNICASMTHYGTAPGVIIYGAGYLSQARWWKVGFLMSLLHAAIWLVIGFAWWKIIGLW